MHRVQAIRLKEMALAPPLSATMQNVAGQLAPTSRKTYTIDVKHFVQWMADQNLSLFSLGRDELVAYRTYLAEQYAKTTASRMWVVARRLLDEAMQRCLLIHNPVEGIRGFKTGDDESPHRALKRGEAKLLLDVINRRTTLGKQDYAQIMLLLRTGIRRAEAVALTIGDLVMEQGYHVAVIEHGKGNKRSFAKLPVEVRQVIDDYLVAGREHVAPEAPLFGVTTLSGAKQTLSNEVTSKGTLLLRHRSWKADKHTDKAFFLYHVLEKRAEMSVPEPLFLSISSHCLLSICFSLLHTVTHNDGSKKKRL